MNNNLLLSHYSDIFTSRVILKYLVNIDWPSIAAVCVALWTGIIYKALGLLIVETTRETSAMLLDFHLACDFNSKFYHLFHALQANIIHWKQESMPEKSIFSNCSSVLYANQHLLLISMRALLGIAPEVLFIFSFRKPEAKITNNLVYTDCLQFLFWWSSFSLCEIIWRRQSY